MNREQFEKLVFPEPNTGCWLWGGRVRSSGYGVGNFEYKIQLAHRYSYLIYKGQFDFKMHVLHHCDVPACVNPEHLYLGDQAQNNLDRDKRGRQRTKHGIDHKLAKLTDETVLEIRRIHNPKTYPSRKLARMFGVSQGTIMHVLKRVTWAHLPQ